MVIASIFTMVGLGVFFATVLAVANQRFKVEEDPRIEELTKKLPGLNCGACGFPNCREFAKGIIERKEAAINSACRLGGPEIIDLISRISGVKKKLAKEIAVVFCGAKNEDKTRKAIYKGIETCRSANIIFGSGMYCEYGCMGFGDCAIVCPFDAIKMVDGLPIVNPDKCTACGKCIEACPRNIIKLMPYDVDNLVITACNSRDGCAFVKKICSVGCIACKICEKLSGDVFVVENNLSKLKVERMREDISWDEIIKKCPTNTILRIK